jgi:hypothetical protein
MSTTNTDTTAAAPATDAAFLSQLDRIRADLQRQGFAIVRNAVPVEVLDTLRETLDREFAELRAKGDMFHGGGSFSGHLNCYPGIAAKPAWESLEAAGLFAAVQELRPDIANKARVTLNYNMPGSVAQHYHIDGVFLREFLICNVAVVDTDLVNGAIDVLPGTNQEFTPFWKYAAQRGYRATTRLPLSKGDAVLRTSTLWHRGMPNLSDVARPMLAVTFGEVDETSDPWKLNDGQIEFYPNWFRPTKIGRLRERVFVAAPISYSTYRFTRSLRGTKGYDH